MGEIDIGASPEIPQDANPVTLGIGNFLCLAAAPTFASMALFTCIQGEAPALCMGAGVSPLTGMPAMYLMMAAVHLAPWLRVMSGRRIGQ